MSVFLPRTIEKLVNNLKYFSSPESPTAKTEYIQKYFAKHRDHIFQCLTDENLKTALSQKFTVFEAVDGVGKTTQINLYKSKGFNTANTPPNGFFETEREREAMINTKDYHLISSIYLGACLCACVEIPKIDVMDRFWPSTYAYQTAQYKEQTGADITEIPTFDYLPNPKRIIYLKMAESLRLKRIANRNKTETLEEEKMRKNLTFTENIKNNYMRFKQQKNIEFIEIEIDFEKTPDMIFTESLKHVLKD